MTELESSIVDSWREAAADLGIGFTSPFVVSLLGQNIDGLGLVHHFGGRVGTIVSRLNYPSPQLPEGLRDQYFVSQLSESFTRYSRQLFIETLDDWQFFGPESQKPSWYTGKPWS